MTRRTLLSAALILLCWMLPSLAQASPATAKAPAQIVPVQMLTAPPAIAEAAPPVVAEVAGGEAFPAMLAGAQTCAAASSPIAAPASVIIPCPYCRPGWIQCGIPPRCRCCGGQ